MTKCSNFPCPNNAWYLSASKKCYACSQRRSSTKNCIVCGHICDFIAHYYNGYPFYIHKKDCINYYKQNRSLCSQDGCYEPKMLGGYCDLHDHVMVRVKKCCLVTCDRPAVYSNSIGNFCEIHFV